mmetsp:Transcript_37448/g.62084  ORF Transcript_37448/g.62084 Transcript_37448/m.62084 type:complete len:103 (+) Transcript_37448:139-447(+)
MEAIIFQNASHAFSAASALVHTPSQILLTPYMYFGKRAICLDTKLAAAGLKFSNPSVRTEAFNRTSPSVKSISKLHGLASSEFTLVRNSTTIRRRKGGTALS